MMEIARKSSVAARTKIASKGAEVPSRIGIAPNEPLHWQSNLSADAQMLRSMN